MNKNYTIGLLIIFILFFFILIMSGKAGALVYLLIFCLIIYVLFEIKMKCNKCKIEREKIQTFIFTLPINDLECQLFQECVICLDEFMKGDIVIYTKCGHVYHYSCIENWVQRKSICPICSTNL
jgi:hypothetical protein